MLMTVMYLWSHCVKGILTLLISTLQPPLNNFIKTGPIVGIFAHKGTFEHIYIQGTQTHVIYILF